MRPPTILSVPSERTSPLFARAWERGVGGTIVDVPPLVSTAGPIACFGSPVLWPMLQEAIADGRDWYYADKGYFERGRYLRITKNAYQHDGRGAATEDRFARLGLEVQPWRQDGRHVLICPNTRVYFQLFGLDVDGWISDVTRQIRAVSDREVRVRWKSDLSSRPIEADLVDAWALVTFSSNAAIDALLAGVPVFALAPFAAARRMGLDDLSAIESPVYPDDRAEFMATLAEQQWTLDEIARGDAWRALQPREEVARVA